MNDTIEIAGTKARLVFASEPDLAGNIVIIERAIIEPERGVDLEVLPLFQVCDRNGRLENVGGEDLRTVDGSQTLSEGEEPMFKLGSKPILDIHPQVKAICHQFFNNKPL